MLHLRTSLPALALASVLALPGLASADEKPAEEKPADDSGTHLQSLELMLRPTLGGAGSGSLVHTSATAPPISGLPKLLDGSTTPYGATFGVGAEVGFRFHPVISGGLRGDLSTVSASTPSDGTTTQLSRSRQSAGLYARGYPLALNESIRRHIDPWFATGILYMHDAQSFHSPIPTSSGTTVDATWKLDHHGVGIPLAIGVDYRLTRAISIGPSFEYTLVVPLAGCASATVPGLAGGFDMCTGGNSATSKAFVADATGAWTAGLDIRFTPF
jgi:hypothetical protein